ncbi:hypothetical protein PBT90_02645 [Algoriphagus halophytocola]|uniref:Uncharacterized protein n=1 Tax=Algoriphagus halophytocola TaxID=2991499 RepID=A0ABY6MH43_9BACT|nr:MULTISPECIES: hypothetical protein [unclassified Algoriphagus]UZD22330.1 hypothetical protein OM944_16925 [Algoriphagus sp. TR-M5]WBL43589.1 hypothetical protein PBT90_02645 [Algoriphagus sp. TR-M9]
MKWTEQPPKILLQRSFLFGITGIVLCVLSLLNTYFMFLEAPMGPLNGVGMALQLVGLSLAVLVIRKRKLAPEIKERAQKMILILAVGLLFFILTL